VGLQAGSPGPWRGGHEQSSTALSRRLVSAIRKRQGREGCSQLATTEAEEIVGIRCQATPSEDIGDLACAIVRSKACELAIALFVVTSF
jgi:hypothetical protein